MKLFVRTAIIAAVSVLALNAQSQQADRPSLRPDHPGVGTVPDSHAGGGGGSSSEDRPSRGDSGGGGGFGGGGDSRPPRGEDHGGGQGGGGGFGGPGRDHDGGDRGNHGGGGFGGGFGGGSSSGGGTWTGGGSSSSDTDWSPSVPSGSWGGSSHSQSQSYGGVGCSPKQVNGNVVSTDKAMKALASSGDFSEAKLFKAQVKGISSLKNDNQKAAEYFNLVGIKTKDSQAVLSFMGAREAKGSWIVELQKHSNLNEHQAEKVAKSIQSALRGGLN